MLLVKLKSLGLLCLLLVCVSLVGWGLMTLSSQAQDRSGLPTVQPLKPTRAAHWVYASVFHPDGERLIISEGVGKVRLWESRTNQPGAVFPGPTLAVYSLSVSPNGKLLAGGCRDGHVYVWEMATQQLKYKEKLPEAILLTVRLGASVQCWDAATWNPLWDARIAGGQSFDLTLSPKQDRLILANTAGCWLFDDLQTGKMPRQVAEISERPPNR